MSSYIFIFDQSICQMHLNFQEVVTYLIYFKLNCFFYILSYLCCHKKFSSTMHKLYFVIYFQNINGALHATCHLLHGYHLCFVLLATYSLQFPSSSATFSPSLCIYSQFNRAGTTLSCNTYF